MLRFLAPALAVLVAGSAAAQPVPGDIFPLDDGNRWVFVQSSWSSGQNGESSSSLEGSVEWAVDGTVEVGGEVLPRLAVTRNGGAPTYCAVGTEVEGDVVSFPFYGTGGAAECPVEINYPASPTASQRGVQVDLALVDTYDLSIGGQPVLGVEVFSSYYAPTGCGSLCDGSVSVGQGLGVYLISEVDSFGPGSRGTTWALRRAEIGGGAVGAALDPGPGFFPLGEGDAWTFAIERKAESSDPYEAAGFVTWAVVDGVLRVGRVEDGVQTALGACVAAVSAATPESSYREQVALTDAPGQACPDGVPEALPALDAYGLFTDGAPAQAGVFLDYFGEGEVSVGGETVPTDVASGSSFRRVAVDGDQHYRSAWTLGRGLGVVGFEQRANVISGPRSVRATLAYARVGGVEYGANPVSGERGPEAGRLSLAVGPNPAHGAARLFVGGDARVRVTVLDALGRVVGTWEAPPGALALDTSGWAAGAYTVRAESAGGVAHARLTVVR